MPFSPAEEKLSKHSLTTLFSLLFAHFWRKYKKVKAIIASSSVTFIPIKSEQLFRFPRKLRFFIELLKAIRRGLNTLLSSNYDKIFTFFQRRGVHGIDPSGCAKCYKQRIWVKVLCKINFLKIICQTVLWQTLIRVLTYLYVRMLRNCIQIPFRDSNKKSEMFYYSYLY